MKLIFIKKFVFLLFFLTICRLLPHEPNFTPIFSVSVLGFLFFKNVDTRLFLVLLSMFLSDIFLGFHSSMFFVYISIVLIIILSNQKNYLIMALLSPIIFFLISNFGVWLNSNIYSKSIHGLFECYIMAIPFLKNLFISTIFYMIIILLFKKFFMYKIFINPKI